MAISFLQQEALASSPDFMAQVSAVVVQQALLKSENPDLDSTGKDILARVIRNPQSYSFHTTIVADAGWALTYDPWAMDPAGSEGQILSGVQKFFELLTGFIPPQVGTMAMTSTTVGEEVKQEGEL
jgi:hypothetical protein